MRLSFSSKLNFYSIPFLFACKLVFLLLAEPPVSQTKRSKLFALLDLSQKARLEEMELAGEEEDLEKLAEEQENLVSARALPFYRDRQCPYRA